jgi:hypothetical protein
MARATEKVRTAAEKVQERRREAAETKVADLSAGQSSGDLPLAELKGSHAKTAEFRPNRVLIFDDRVEEHDRDFLKKRMQTIHFVHVAQISVKRGMVWSEVAIESTGGHSIVARGLAKTEADEAKKLLDRLLRESRGRGVATYSAPVQNDIPEQIRKLGELKDAGLISTEEFEAKKTELLSRM